MQGCALSPCSRIFAIDSQLPLNYRKDELRVSSPLTFHCLLFVVPNCSHRRCQWAAPLRNGLSRNLVAGSSCWSAQLRKRRPGELRQATSVQRQTCSCTVRSQDSSPTASAARPRTRLGPLGLQLGRQLAALPPSTPGGSEARPVLHACRHGLHRFRNHGQAPGLLSTSVIIFTSLLNGLAAASRCRLKVGLRSSCFQPSASCRGIRWLALRVVGATVCSR